MCYCYAYQRRHKAVKCQLNGGTTNFIVFRRKEASCFYGKENKNFFREDEEKPLWAQVDTGLHGSTVKAYWAQEVDRQELRKLELASVVGSLRGNARLLSSSRLDAASDGRVPHRPHGFQRILRQYRPQWVLGTTSRHGNVGRACVCGGFGSCNYVMIHGVASMHST